MNEQTTAPATIEMPRLGTYADMRRLTGKARPTVYKWVCKKRLKPGVYIGQGLFNLSRVN
jgi:predicted DNA-binding transcriptional regulator AlpA